MSDRPEEPAVEHDPTITYTPVGGATAEAAAGRVAGSFKYALVVERGPRAGLTYVLGDGATTAGRSEESDIYLGDVTVSRHHVKFVVDAAGLHLEDLGSTNGTYVNMERCDQASLEPGDEVIVGKFHLIVVKGDG